MSCAKIPSPAASPDMSEGAELIYLRLGTSRQFKTNLKTLLLTYAKIKIHLISHSDNNEDYINSFPEAGTAGFVLHLYGFNTAFLFLPAVLSCLQLKTWEGRKRS